MRLKTILKISIDVIMWSLAIIALLLMAVSDTWFELTQAMLLLNYAMLAIVFDGVKNNLTR